MLFVFLMEVGIFVCQYFSYSEGCLCLSLRVSFAVQMLLWLIRSWFLISGLFSVILRSTCKSTWCNCWQSVSFLAKCVFLGNFLGSVLTLGTLHYLEFLLAHGVSKSSHLTLFSLGLRSLHTVICCGSYLVPSPASVEGVSSLLSTPSPQLTVCGAFDNRYSLVWGDTLWCFGFPFLNTLVTLTAFHATCLEWCDWNLPVEIGSASCLLDSFADQP